MPKSKADKPSEDENLTKDPIAEESGQDDAPQEAPEETVTASAEDEIIDAPEAEEESPAAEVDEQDVLDAAEEDAPEIIEETAIEEVDIQPEEPAPAPPPPPPPAPAEQKRSVVPMVLAGVVTAAAGFFAGQGGLLQSVFPPEEPPVVENPEIVALKDQVETLQASLSTAQDAIADLTNQVANLPEPAAAPTALDIPQEIYDRLTALENLPAPVVDDNVPEELQSQFSNLQASAEQQQTELQSLLDELKSRDEEALLNAKRAEARAAMAQINTALGSGSGFADALASLKGAMDIDVPDALTQTAENGAPTLTAIQDGVADAARAALSAAREETADSSGLAGFLQRQLGARSVAPRAGDDPDAVLSRVEAAIRQGDLDQALAEADALPESAKTAMADWLAITQTRSDVLKAAEAVTAQLAG